MDTVREAGRFKTNTEPGEVARLLESDEYLMEDTRTSSIFVFATL
jgi:hypothetical protein